jgi:hypothetical protein
MRLPNASRALIPREKLYDYLLSRAHPIGRFKATFFATLGYQSDVWQRLEADLREQHLSQEAKLAATMSFGVKYEIRAILKGPIGPPRPVVSVWFIANGQEIPRFVTAYPGGAE